ncbi:MAG: DUF4040 domain-containing protein [Cyanothece sp. SIO2G6]|nr:DUF4040 domain-containing protein [Cyanothece sp. SIO2G6]
MTDFLPFDDIYGVAIALLLPITATILVVQRNPYYALVLRGIVGAVAALVYALFGAADVALTEALVGTMLSITLYAIAVRSSLSMQLGVLASSDLDQRKSLDMLTNVLRQSLQHQHLRLELVPYHSITALQTALEQKDVHSIAFLADSVDYNGKPVLSLYEVRTRVLRLHSLLSQLPEEVVHPVYVSIPSTVVTPPQVSTQSIFEQSDVEQIKGV